MTTRRGARVAIMDRNTQSADRLLERTCTDDQGNFALALASRYDPEAGPFDEPRHLIDVYARVLLNADELCAGIPAVTVQHWSDTTTWSFDGPVRMDVAGTLEVPGPGRSGRPALAAWPSPAVDRAVFLLAAGDANGAPSVGIYDVAGRRVRDLALKQATGSAWREEWDLRDEAGARVRPGVYFVRCWLGGTALLKTMVVMR